MDLDFGNYPHLSRFLMNLEQKAQIKRQDRELEEQFGTVDELEEEEIWRAEQAKR